MSEGKLPLKRVLITSANYFNPGGGGGDKTIFGPVTPLVRSQLARSVRSVAAHFGSAFTRNPGAAAVARVVLKPEAVAKSHRPSWLFDKANCPIVGIGALGELLVSVSASTLPQLESSVLSQTTGDAEANISTILRVEPFEIAEPRLLEISKEIEKDGIEAIKLRLFRHHEAKIDLALETALHQQLNDFQIKYEPLPYGPGMAIYRLRRVKPQHIASLGRFVGTQSLGAFPRYHVVRPAAQPVGKLNSVVFPPPERGVEYPVVGVIDTGVDPANALLAPWIVAREEYVPIAERDYGHGTFVAGLVVHARALNHNDERFPQCPCRIVDVVALSRSGTLPEDQLVAILREVVPKYPAVRVWNLSLSGNEPCSDHAFSDLAIALDDLQTQHEITFVIASGNYAVPPFRDWPPTAVLGETDRICSPADSARALTVGSMTHRDSPSSRAPVSCPSPFSRRGPGAVYFPKPEISYYGGNCDAMGRHAQIGILSVDAQGNLAESIGTSFAAPIASAVLAYVQVGPAQPLSSLMAKALLIHSAVLADSTETQEQLDYRGFGVPGDLQNILGCDPWRATLLFETEVRAGLDLQRTPFPIPDCLRTPKGAFRGEMTVTLLSEPTLDGTFGAEYCRSHVEVSLGTYAPNDSGTLEQLRQIPPFPKRTEKHPLEKKRVEHGFKWSPLKVYRRVIPKGVNGDIWRLLLAGTDRSGADNLSMRVAVVVTIADTQRKASVYTDVIRAMNQLGWVATDVQLRERERARR